MLASSIPGLLATYWFVVIPFAIIVWLAGNYFNKGLNKFPGSVVGSLTNWTRFYYAYKGRPEQWYKKVHDEHGDIVRLGPNLLSFSNPEAVKTIYALNNGFIKSDFYPVHKVMSKGRQLDSMFATKDEKYHANMRRSVSSAFAMSQIVQYEPRVDHTCNIFLEETDRKKANTGQVIELTSWLQLFAFDVITEATYSQRLGFIEQDGDIEGILAGLNAWFHYIGPVGQMPFLDYLFKKNPIWSYLDKWGYIDNTSSMARFSQARIDERKRQLEQATELSGEDALAKAKPTDLLTAFLKAKNERPDFFDDGRILTVATSLTSAGSDTTAISLAAVLYYLCKYPSCYQKLSEELDAAAKSGLIPEEPTEVVSWTAAQQLPYLDACIKEGFRMHAAVAFILERIVPPEGATISGEFIPGGTIVGCNSWIIHKRREVFGEDVETFRPERWLIDPQKNHAEEEARVKLMASTLFHFGAGSRACLGRHISLLEIYKLVPSFLRRFQIHIVDPNLELKMHNAWFIKQLNFYVTITSKTAKV